MRQNQGKVRSSIARHRMLMQVRKNPNIRKLDKGKGFPQDGVEPAVSCLNGVVALESRRPVEQLLESFESGPVTWFVNKGIEHWGLTCAPEGRRFRVLCPSVVISWLVFGVVARVEVCGA